MRSLLCALAGLALLRAAGAFVAAEPLIPSHGDLARSPRCDRHLAVHSRLHVIEEIPPGHGRRRSPAADVMYLSDSFLLRTEPCILAFLPQLCAQ
nr:placenta-specific protein 9 isoform X4 [Equus asinus]